MSRLAGEFTVLHVSDVHATESGRLFDAVDGLTQLARVGDYARATGIAPDAVVITGDLAQRGQTGAYPAVEAACRRLEDALGAPVLTVLGNHDDPIAARSLSGHELRHFGARMIDGVRIVRLDSHARKLGAEQLAWLRAELQTPAERGTIVALHHAPIGSPMPVLRQQGLADADALLDVLSGAAGHGTDRGVRALLAGHFHHVLTAQVRGVPVFVGPSLAYHQVMDAGPDAVAGYDAPAFSLVQLTADAVCTSTVPLTAPAPLFVRPAAPTAAVNLLPPPSDPTFTEPKANHAQ